jgi:hypothetical protein
LTLWNLSFASLKTPFPELQDLFYTALSIVIQLPKKLRLGKMQSNYQVPNAAPDIDERAAILLDLIHVTLEHIKLSPQMIGDEFRPCKRCRVISF